MLKSSDEVIGSDSDVEDLVRVCPLYPTKQPN
jgi:hypothetical protein